MSFSLDIVSQVTTSSSTPLDKGEQKKQQVIQTRDDIVLHRQRRVLHVVSRTDSDTSDDDDDDDDNTPNLFDEQMIPLWYSVAPSPHAQTVHGPLTVAQQQTCPIESDYILNEPPLISAAGGHPSASAGETSSSTPLDKGERKQQVVQTRDNIVLHRQRRVLHVVSRTDSDTSDDDDNDDDNTPNLFAGTVVDDSDREQTSMTMTSATTSMIPLCIRKNISISGVPRNTPQFLGCSEIFVSFERSKNIL
ncbi:hypothetical protein FB446DRAFT_798035, partial [Lentinula raphanica]